jgi:drug/metabolite transporter (DMT)-like permease
LADIPPDNARPGQTKPLWTALLVLVTVIWGASFIAIKQIVSYVTPLELVTVRFVPVALAFALLLLPTRGREVWRVIRAESWRLPLLGLVGGVLYNIFLGWGETGVAAGTASLIIALNPAFTYALSVVFLKERFRYRRLLGIIVAFAGLFVIIRWGSGREVTLEDARYALATMLAPLCWAVYTIAGKPVVARQPPVLVTGIALAYAGIFSLAFATPSLLARLPELPLSFWAATLFLALFCTVLGFSVWYSALEHMTAGRIAGFVYLVPLFAVTMGALLFDEQLTPSLAVGAAILIGGVYLVNRE